MTTMQELALMLDDAAAQTRCLALIPLLCSLRDLTCTHQDHLESDAVLTQRVKGLCREATCGDISRDVPAMVRQLVFQLLPREDALPETSDLPRRRCCRAAEQIRTVGKIRRWYMNLLNLWDDVLFRQAETDAFDTQQSVLYVEYERLLLLWRTAIMARNIERNMEWLGTLEAWNESLSGVAEARRSMKEALNRAELQSESLDHLLGSTN